MELKMKIVWLSANKFGYELLKETIQLKNTNVRAIITLSSKSKTIMYDGVENKSWHKLGRDVFEIEQLNEEKDLLKKLSPDLIIMCGWRQIINKNILSIPRKGIIGFHPTLLPYGRGPAPIINTLLSGITTSGVTMFYVSGGLDDGDIIAQKKFSISKTDYAQNVYTKIIKAGKNLIREYLPRVIKGNAPRVPQDNTKATVFEKPEFKDNELNLDQETLDQVSRKIKAFSKPYKGAYIKRGNRKLVIWKAESQDIK